MRTEGWIVYTNDYGAEYQMTTVKGINIYLGPYVGNRIQCKMGRGNTSGNTYMYFDDILNRVDINFFMVKDVPTKVEIKRMIHLAKYIGAESFSIALDVIRFY